MAAGPVLLAWPLDDDQHRLLRPARHPVSMTTAVEKHKRAGVDVQNERHGLRQGRDDSSLLILRLQLPQNIDNAP